jgi:hypothetical protein
LRNAERQCLWVKGDAIDAAIGALLLETVAPAAIEVALAVQQEIAQRVEQAGELRQAQLQRARYEAELARRRYAKVDPDNRLVADALEAEWNDRLRQLDALQRGHERQQQADQALMNEPARTRIVGKRSANPSSPSILKLRTLRPQQRRRRRGGHGSTADAGLPGACGGVSRLGQEGFGVGR